MDQATKNEVKAIAVEAFQESLVALLVHQTKETQVGIAIAQIVKDIKKIDGRVDNLESMGKDHTVRLDRLEDKVDKLDGRVGNLENKVDNLEGNMNKQFSNVALSLEKILEKVS